MKKTCINIKAYSLSANAAILQPASSERTWLHETGHISTEVGCSVANGQGWNVLCPYAFEATWNGGANIEDIEIRAETPEKGLPTFAQSQLGGETIE